MGESMNISWISEYRSGLSLIHFSFLISTFQFWNCPLTWWPKPRLGFLLGLFLKIESMLGFYQHYQFLNVNESNIILNKIWEKETVIQPLSNFSIINLLSGPVKSQPRMNKQRFTWSLLSWVWPLRKATLWSKEREGVQTCHPRYAVLTHQLFWAEGTWEQ